MIRDLWGRGGKKISKARLGRRCQGNNDSQTKQDWKKVWNYTDWDSIHKKDLHRFKPDLNLRTEKGKWTCYKPNRKAISKWYWETENQFSSMECQSFVGEIGQNKTNSIDFMFFWVFFLVFLSDLFFSLSCFLSFLLFWYVSCFFFFSFVFRGKVGEEHEVG